MDAEKRLRKQNFRKEHKVYFRILDIIIVMSVLFNFSALFLTIALVDFDLQKSANQGNFQIEKYEANPTKQQFKQVDDLNITEQQKNEKKAYFVSVMKLILMQSGFWALLITLYLVYRNNISSSFGLYALFFFVCTYFFIISYDLINNLALMVSELRYGGCL